MPINLLETIWLHKSRNINANIWLWQRHLPSNLELPLTMPSFAVCVYVTMQLQKCRNTTTTNILDFKPLQLQKLQVPSIRTRNYGSTQQNTAAYSLMFNLLLCTSVLKKPYIFFECTFAYRN